jgi:hypothetical protein
MYERHCNGIHSFDIQLMRIPADLPMNEVMRELKKNFLKDWYPYEYSGLRHYPKQGWILQLSTPLPLKMTMLLDTREEEKLLEHSYKESFRELEY